MYVYTLNFPGEPDMKIYRSDRALHFTFKIYLI